MTIGLALLFMRIKEIFICRLNNWKDETAGVQRTS